MAEKNIVKDLNIVKICQKLDEIDTIKKILFSEEKCELLDLF